jgi:hypothetical protein
LIDLQILLGFQEPFSVKGHDQSSPQYSSSGSPFKIIELITIPAINTKKKRFIQQSLATLCRSVE